MYHCKLYFYLAGYPCEAVDIIRKMQPMENFTHEFLGIKEITSVTVLMFLLSHSINFHSFPCLCAPTDL